MPLYDLKCGSCGHMFERVLPASQFDQLHECEACGGGATVQVPAPALLGTESATAGEDERVYREHNVTREHYAGAGVSAEPVSAALQCQCGNCGAHRKRAAVTGTAEPGKER